MMHLVFLEESIMAGSSGIAVNEYDVFEKKIGW